MASSRLGDGSGGEGAPFIDSSKLDLKRYARQPALAMVLADYLIYVERNPRKVRAESRGDPHSTLYFDKPRAVKILWRANLPGCSRSVYRRNAMEGMLFFQGGQAMCPCR